MIIREAAAKACKLLEHAQVEDAAFESELLLRHALKINRAGFFAGTKNEIPKEQETSYFELVKRRISGEPSAYILGKREFYGLEFLVDKSVLIPRPETELLVEEAITILSKTEGEASCADIGTGSGAIAVSIAKNTENVKVTAIDLSEEALKTARLNGRKHEVENKITFLCGNLLEPLKTKVDLVTANLPYVKEGDKYDNDFEPALALFGGADGLEVINKLCSQLESKLKSGGTALLEVGLGQAEEVSSRIKTLYPKAKTSIIKDFAGIERIVKIKMP